MTFDREENYSPENANERSLCKYPFLSNDLTSGGCANAAGDG